MQSAESEAKLGILSPCASACQNQAPAFKADKKRRQEEPLADSEVSPWQSPAQELESKWLCERVQGALMSLNTDYRTGVVLKHISGCSYQQISEILQLPEKTVKSRLYSARQLMKKTLLHGESDGAGLS